MKALVYNGPKDVRLAEKPIPAVSDTDVLIKVLYCGVCGMEAADSVYHHTDHE